MQQNTSALLDLLFAPKNILPTQRTHAPDARSFHFAPTCYFLSLRQSRDFPCAKKLPCFFLVGAPDTCLAPGPSQRISLLFPYGRDFPCLLALAIHAIHGRSIAPETSSATVLPCGIQGTSAAPAIHPVLPCFSVEGTSSTPAIHAVPPNNFCSDCSLAHLYHA